MNHSFEFYFKDMPYNRLGKSGLQISRLSFGSWVTFHSQLDLKESSNLMNLAFESGVNFFDNAEVYAGGKSEEIMGECFKKLNWPRLQYIVSTKFFWGLNPGPNQRNTLNRKYLMHSITGSLKRLQMDYVDLIYCHRPDPQTPLEETVRAMNDIIEKGYALYWGTSEWSAEEIRGAYEIAKANSWHPPVVEQPQYNLVERKKVEVEYSRLYPEIGLGLTIWSPLASGLLTGKYNGGMAQEGRLNQRSFDWLRDSLMTESNMKRTKQLSEMAKGLDATPAQLAIAWTLANPHVSSVILGASQKQQLEENLESLRVYKNLRSETVTELNQIFSLG